MCLTLKIHDSDSTLACETLRVLGALYGLKFVNAETAGNTQRDVFILNTHEFFFILGWSLQHDLFELLVKI